MNSPTIPCDLEAERAVIGSVLLDPASAERLTEMLPTPEAFYLERHAAIWRAIHACVNARVPADLVTVGARLRQDVATGGAVGLAELDACMASAVEPNRAPFYATIVAEAAARRRIIDAGGRITRIGYDQSLSLAEAQDAVSATIYSVASDADTDGFVSISQAARERADQYMEASAGDDAAFVGIPTPYRDLNELLGGLRPGDLIGVGGRPSMGKSALMNDFAAHVAGRHGLHVGIFSMEMTRAQLIDRFVSRESGIELTQIINNRVPFALEPKRLEAVGEIDQWPVSIDHTRGLTVTAIRSRARRLHMQRPLDLLIVDYLQLVATSDPRETENEALTRISRGLKNLAGELNIPVIALAQLSRRVEDRPNKRPMLSDVRGSGSIEQDVDVMMFLYRDEYYYSDTDQPGIAEINVAKHRNGATGTVFVRFHRECTTFRDLTPAHRDYQQRGHRHAAD